MLDIVKRNGVVYTPDWVVTIIHDNALPENLGDISICDPACGDGVFLVDVAKRICKQATCSDDPQPYLNSLHNLTGFDIDSTALMQCRHKLDEVVSKHYPNFDVQWNLNRIDALDIDQWRNWRECFDHIVGNPPYIRIQHLEDKRRELIRKGPWKTLSGCTDLYILFFEYGMELLRQGGSLCYITPNSWLKSKAGTPLREFLKSYTISYILDFDCSQVFEGVSTYTAITKVTKSTGTPAKKAEKYVNGKIVPGYQLEYYKDKLVLLKEGKSSLMGNSCSDTSLGELARIQVGIQTLADRVFILPVVHYESDSVVCTDGFKRTSIEADITKTIYKASVMQDGRDKVDRIIIYPYDENGNLIPEADLKKQFPKAYRWLRSNKAILLNRDKGKPRKYAWYEYGRSVGVTTAFGIKILTSGMNRLPNFQVCDDEDSLFYSGYGIKPKSWVDTEKLLKELNSEFMDYYIKSVSKPFQHGWRSYAKSFIQDFPLNSSKITL